MQTAFQHLSSFSVEKIRSPQKRKIISQLLHDIRFLCLVTLHRILIFLYLDRNYISPFFVLDLSWPTSRCGKIDSTLSSSMCIYFFRTLPKVVISYRPYLTGPISQDLRNSRKLIATTFLYSSTIRCYFNTSAQKTVHC